MKRLAVATVTVIALVACGRLQGDAGSSSTPVPSGPTATGPSGSGVPNPVAPDPAMWERPLADIGIEVDSDDPDVFAQLDYEPVLPDPTLGEPVATFISDVEIVGDAGQEVAWVFDDDAAGRYLVIESPSGATQADLEAPAHLIPGCHTTSPVIEGADPPVECVLDDFSLVAIRGDVSALVVENQYVTAVSWLEPMTVRDPDTFADFGNLTLEIEIMAPAGGATLDELVDIADRF